MQFSVSFSECIYSQIMYLPNTKMSENQTARLGRRFTKKLDMMRLTHNKVNFDVTCDDHQNSSKYS